MTLSKGSVMTVDVLDSVIGFGGSCTSFILGPTLISGIQCGFSSVGLARNVGKFVAQKSNEYDFDTNDLAYRRRISKIVVSCKAPKMYESLESKNGPSVFGGCKAVYPNDYKGYPRSRYCQ